MVGKVNIVVSWPVQRGFLSSTSHTALACKRSLINWHRNVSNQFQGSYTEHYSMCLCLQTSACKELAVRNAITSVPHTICG
jgi:hypothetical protein